MANRTPIGVNNLPAWRVGTYLMQSVCFALWFHQLLQFQKSQRHQIPSRLENLFWGFQVYQLPGAGVLHAWCTWKALLVRYRFRWSNSARKQRSLGELESLLELDLVLCNQFCVSIWSSSQSHAKFFDRLYRRCNGARLDRLHRDDHHWVFLWF